MNYYQKQLQFDIGQFQGVFEVEGEIQHNCVIGKALQQLPNTTPQVIIEERYFRNSAARKLLRKENQGTTRNLSQRLDEQRLIRPKPGFTFNHQKVPISNLSLAQTLSWAYQEPIEDILISEQFFNSEEFLENSNDKRIRFLFNAYDQVVWFEDFKKRFRKRKSPPQIKPGQRVRLRDLHEILCTADYVPSIKESNLTKLVDRGFILPAEPSFHKHSLTNFVNTHALVTFLSLLSQKRPKKIIMSENKDMVELVSSYIHNRFLPFVIENEIGLQKDYTMTEAGKIAKVSRTAFWQRATRSKLKSAIKTRKKRPVIPGFDLVTHVLKNTQKTRFYKEDILDLFGAKDFDLEGFGLRQSRMGTYSKCHHVFPFYDHVAQKAKSMYSKHDEDANLSLSTYFPVNGDTYSLTPGAMIAYCRANEVRRFGPECLEQIRYNVQEGKRKNGQCSGPQLLLTIGPNNTISSVRLETKGYKHLEDSSEPELV
jgi:hypothetical protein